MKMRATWGLILLTVGIVHADVPATSFDRYGIILDRKPFGDLPPPVQAPPPPPKEEVIVKSYRLCSIVQEDNGTLKVGLIDLRSNKAVVLSPGESENGLKLLEASYDKENAMVQLGEEIQVLDLKSGGTAPAAAPGQPPVTTMAAPQPSAPQPSSLSYADRRRQRLLQQQEPQAAPQPKYTGEALQKHLQDYQLEVIRQGLPPLPIPLTREQDDQLVKEGVLPPQQGQPVPAAPTQ